MTPTPGERVEEAYLDAICCIAEVIGISHEMSGITRPPAVDLDQLPGSVIVAGQQAIKYLSVGAGLLETPDESDAGEIAANGLDADDVLAAWAKAAES